MGQKMSTKIPLYSYTLTHLPAPHDSSQVIGTKIKTAFSSFFLFWPEQKTELFELTVSVIHNI